MPCAIQCCYDSNMHRSTNGWILDKNLGGGGGGGGGWRVGTDIYFINYCSNDVRYPVC